MLKNQLCKIYERKAAKKLKTSQQKVFFYKLFKVFLLVTYNNLVPKNTAFASGLCSKDSLLAIKSEDFNI